MIEKFSATSQSLHESSSQLECTVDNFRAHSALHTTNRHGLSRPFVTISHAKLQCLFLNIIGVNLGQSIMHDSTCRAARYSKMPREYETVLKRDHAEFESIVRWPHARALCYIPTFPVGRDCSPSVTSSSCTSTSTPLKGCCGASGGLFLFDDIRFAIRLVAMDELAACFILFCQGPTMP